MSLHEAVEMIAQAMEEEAKDLTDDQPIDGGRGYCAMTLRGYVRQLRIALKSSSVGEGTVSAPPPGPSWQQQPPQIFQAPANANLGNLLLPGMGITDPRVAEALRQDQLARQRRKSDAQEGLEPIQRELVGMPGEEGTVTFAPVPQEMPVNAKTSVNGHVFQLRDDGRLHYCPPDQPA